MNEKLRILKMVEDGKISAEDACKLIEKLCEDNSTKEKESNMQLEKNYEEFLDFTKNQSKEKLICIRVLSSDGDKVKVNLPLNIVKLLLQNGNKIPGVNLEDIDMDFKNIIEYIEEGFSGRIVDIDSENGDKVIIEII